MTDLKRAAEIAAQLERSEDWRQRGRTAVAIAGTILSAIPIAGGPLSGLIDKVGAALVDPELEANFAELCNLVAMLAPEIDRLDDIEEKVSVTAAALKANQGALDRLTEMLGRLHPHAVDVFGVNTEASRQDFIDVTISDMSVLIEAHQRGFNYLRNVKTTGGGVQFNSTSGGYQKVVGSNFRGRSGSSVGMNNLTVQGPVKTLEDHPEKSGIGLGPGGSIGFGPGGVLRFGTAKRKDN